jgi:hypothetical protein
MNPEDFKIEKKGTSEKWYDKETRRVRKQIYYYESGAKYFEGYYANGYRHREDGPALQEWNENGTKKLEEYWLDGKRYPKEEYDKIMLAKKFELI